MQTNLFEYRSSGDCMCDELKELLSPEIVQFKIQLARQNKQLADNAAEIARLKKMLADKGINAKKGAVGK